MSCHKFLGTKAIELPSCAGEKGEAAKWDLIKVLGNETQCTTWIAEFFLCEGVLIGLREGSHCYRKTERGALFYRLLMSANLIDLFGRVGGNHLPRLRTEWTEWPKAVDSVPWLDQTANDGIDLPSFALSSLL